MLSLRGVVKHYAAPDGELVRAIDDVDLEIQPGELLAVYGPSGSGKSTLLMLMAALLRPDRGAVAFDGHDLSTLSARSAADYRLREIGLVRQAVDLVPGMSALDNAALKLLVDHRRSAARATVEPLLAHLGLDHRRNHRAEALSVGERQRVMIARALSTEPRVVLADEPTAALDSQRGAEVLDLLATTAAERGTAVVLVTHDPRGAARADRALRLHDGRLGAYEPAPVAGP